LQSPEASIPPEETAISIEAAIALRVRFAGTPTFDALVELLTGGGKPKKH
jgi:hypothetical protein